MSAIGTRHAHVQYCGINPTPTQVQTQRAHLHRDIAESCGRFARGSDERGSLVERLVQVLLQRELCVKLVLLLADLAARKISDHLADQLDHLHARAEPCQQ